MAINSFDLICDKKPSKSIRTSCSPKDSNTVPCRLMKIDFATDGNIINGSSKHGKLLKNKDLKSPYLTGDRVQLLSRVTEKRLVHKKRSDFSSFPLAVNIYKANSDEFNSLKRKNKKTKKSVLTLPNYPAPVPQTCTVSDMNDSEYYNGDDNNNYRKIKAKRRLPYQNNRKARGRNKDFEFYDRDARYCSQLNIDLDCSSTDMIKHFQGDGKCISKEFVSGTSQRDQDFKAHDVWAVLRNINRFQFRPSPPLSEESLVSPRKKKGFKKKRGHPKNRSYIETCRTEEFAYISSLEVDDCKSPSFSQSSSFDRITVIDKQENFSDVCKEFEKKVVHTRNLLKDKNNVKGQTKNKSQNKKILCSNIMKAGGTKEKNNQLSITKRNELQAHNKDNKYLYTLTDNNSYGKKDSLVSSNIVDNFQYSDEYEKTLPCDVTVNDKINDLPHNIVSSTQTDQFNCTSGRFTNSGNSGSSKRGLTKFNFKKENERNSLKTDTFTENERNSLKTDTFTENERNSLKTVQHTSTDFGRQINGITKVVLSKGRDVASSKPYEISKRKPRSVTTMPSTFIIPKLTQTDIRRKLANIKFPVVILDKDQLSSTIEVANYDFPQFNGLDEHIWPFMFEWSEQHISETVENSVKNNMKSADSDINKRRNIINNFKKVNNEIYLNKSAINKDKIAKKANISTYRKVSEQKSIMSTAETKSQKTKNLKPICQLKDKMLKLIYKSSAQNFNNAESKSRQNTAKYKKYNKTPTKNDNIETKVNVSTETDIKCNLLSKNKSSKNITTEPVVNRKMPPTKPWARTKWASDFIENVIRKIKNGVYYNHENQDSYQKSTNKTKEVSMQTPPNLFTQNHDQSLDLICDKFIQKSYLKTLPGFDDILSALEIKTLNTNEIIVKHCLMNVVVQFDVTVPTDPNHVYVKKSSSCIPITVTDSQTKIFKCKTSIFNAMLPAEICTILPKMMRKLIDCNENSMSLMSIDKTNSQLTTISELSQSENIEPFQILISSDIHVSPKIKKTLNGQFAKKTMKLTQPSYTFTNNIMKTYNRIWSSVTELLPTLSRKVVLFRDPIAILPMICKVKSNNALTTSKSNENLVFAEQNVYHCTTIQSYMTCTKKIAFKFEPYNLIDMLNKITNCSQINILSYINLFKNYLRPDTETIRLNIILTENNQYVDKTVCFNVSNLKIDSISKCFTTRRALETEIIDVTNNLFECTEKDYFNINKTGKKECFRNRNQLSNNKNRKKSFVRLYKKCKSTSNISGERCFTSLNKITNLDDFLQIISSGKALSSVFDSYMERKILSSLIEMKSWITEMSSRQALLVLLLLNKKETPNLVRFRPIILQGIAVNRITRASELEMEIEVIERENFNKFSQYEGLSYLSPSIENHDNLLEELYWIAKTTASDYQRPFDESSEKLLISLLEKRKKLNPSYLRVMARYVGLGLLKRPNKN